MTDQTYTHLEVEAALCMWEHLDQLTDLAKDHPSPTQVRRIADELRQTYGTVELRHACIHAAGPFLRLYDCCVAVDADIFDGFAYDWEVVPAFLDAALPFVKRLLDEQGVSSELAAAFTKHGPEIIREALLTLRVVEADRSA